MQALGNDFMVIDTLTQTFSPHASIIQQWSNRHFGIGFDQFLMISSPKDNSYDYHYQIFNADGQEVGQCGNGARCAAQYIHRYLNPHKSHYHLKTQSTEIYLSLLDTQVELTLPCPKHDPQSIPFHSAGLQDNYPIVLSNGVRMDIHVMNVGNPHAIVVVKNIQEIDIQTIGPLIENHPLFPQKCNVNFMQILNPSEMVLRVWERGCGETLACGSGALASAAAGRLYHHMNALITVHLQGGDLSVNWPDIHGSISQIGPAQEVYRGQVSYS